MNNRVLLLGVINKAASETREVQPETGFLAGPNKWSTAVRAWVRDFQQARQGEPLPAFDSLFKDAYRESRMV